MAGRGGEKVLLLVISYKRQNRPIVSKSLFLKVDISSRFIEWPNMFALGDSRRDRQTNVQGSCATLALAAAPLLAPLVRFDIIVLFVGFSSLPFLFSLYDYDSGSQVRSIVSFFFLIILLSATRKPSTDVIY